MNFETLLFEEADSVATVTLNRPEKRNAINRKMFDEIAEAFTYIADSKQIRAFVLTGMGDHFCSGADLSGLDEAPRTPAEMLQRMNSVHEVMSKVVNCPKP